jgi:DNA-binding response OmpR family regulator
LPSSAERSAEPSAEPVTVTISIAASGPERRNRVLAALRELIEAAGPDAAVAGSSSVPSPVLSPVLSSGLGEASVVLDPLPRTVLRDGSPLELSRLEYDLLLFLAEHPRQVFSRSQLLSQVWGHTHTSARTIDVHVSRLRTKLGPDSDVITTVYGLGYRLSDDVPVAVIRR